MRRKKNVFQCEGYNYEHKIWSNSTYDLTQLYWKMKGRLKALRL